MGHRFQSWRQEFLHPPLQELAAARIWMHGIPEIVPITPHVLSQSAGHRWGPWLARLVQALMQQHKVVEVDHQPHPRMVPALTRRATPGAAAQGGTQTAQGPIPALHEGGVDGRSQPRRPMSRKKRRGPP